MPPSGLEAVYLANRSRLVRFLAARGAGSAAEDLVQDLWVKVSGRPDGPIANPLSYLFRAADTLMIDRYRARKQAELREQDWAAAEPQTGETEFASDRAIISRQEAWRVTTALAELGPRKETVFRRARLDGVSHREIAAELGVSVSTVEADLRAAARVLAELKEQLR
jgi:RNA polymerase sigma factor (sigma-70 family)